MKALTDIEICERIAVIEGWRTHTLRGYVAIDKDSYESEYNPLTDDALCTQLIRHHKVSISFKSEGVMCSIKDEFNGFTIGGSLDEDFNKAVCLAIISAKSMSKE